MMSLLEMFLSAPLLSQMATILLLALLMRWKKNE